LTSGSWNHRGFYCGGSEGVTVKEAERESLVRVATREKRERAIEGEFSIGTGK
jgi:hypothetical protein